MTDRFAIETLEISDTTGVSALEFGTAEAVREGVVSITDTHIVTDVSNTGKVFLMDRIRVRYLCG